MTLVERGAVPVAGVGGVGGLVRVRADIIPGRGNVQPPVQRTGRRIGGSVQGHDDLAVADLPPTSYEYCRATPGEKVPAFANPVSTMTGTSGESNGIANPAILARTGSTVQVEDAVNCWSC